MSAEAGATPREGAGGEPPLEWAVNPWREDPRRSSVALAIAAVVVYGAAGFALPPLTFLAIALAFLVGVSPSFLPTRFRVDERGVARRTGPVWHRREWTAIRRAVVRARPPLSPRVWLSTEAEPGLLDRFRGMGLSVPVDDPRLLQELRHRLALHGL